MRVKVTAIARGTHIQSTPPGIVRFDPEGSDPRSREPVVEHTEIPALVKAGLIKDPGVDLSKFEAAPPVAMDLTGVNLERHAAQAGDALAARPEGISSTETRGATSFPPDQAGVVDGAEPGIQAGDPDAPPAKTKKSGAAADAGDGEAGGGKTGS